MKKVVYKISYEGQFCIVFNPEDIPSFIENEIITMEGELSEIKVEPIEMTEKELEEIGEFEGF